MTSHWQMFQVWVTKHVSHFCGTNKHLSGLDTNIDNSCPCCGQANESTSHITWYLDAGNIKIFLERINTLCTWIQQTGMDKTLVSSLAQIFKGHGTITLGSFFNNASILQPLGQDIDALGWDNFCEGRISKSLFEYQHTHLVNSGSSWRSEPGLGYSYKMRSLLHTNNGFTAIHGFILGRSKVSQCPNTERLSTSSTT